MIIFHCYKQALVIWSKVMTWCTSVFCHTLVIFICIFYIDLSLFYLCKSQPWWSSVVCLISSRNKWIYINKDHVSQFQNVRQASKSFAVITLQRNPEDIISRGPEQMISEQPAEIISTGSWKISPESHMETISTSAWEIWTLGGDCLL